MINRADHFKGVSDNLGTSSIAFLHLWRKKCLFALTGVNQNMLKDQNELCNPALNDAFLQK